LSLGEINVQAIYFSALKSNWGANCELWPERASRQSRLVVTVSAAGAPVSREEHVEGGAEHGP
jgi:hypothetical protein